MRAVHERREPGTDERELGNLAERAYVGRGGTTHIHYFAATPMDAPLRACPPSGRRRARSSAATC